MLVVTPNLCFDSTMLLADLCPGTVQRARFTEITGGGKGVNVTRAATATGTTGIHLVGFVADAGSDHLRGLLAAEGIGLVPIAVPGAVRVCTIALEDSGRTTVVNGPGPTISAQAWQALTAAVAERLEPGEVMVCDGSLPPGAPADGYARLVDLAHQRASLAVVDAAPQALQHVLTRQPDLISPNLSEAEGLLHGRVGEQVDESGADVVDRACAAAVELHRRGARRAVVSAGASGAALATDDGCWWFDAPPVTVVSPIGAGDSFVGAAAPLLAAGADDLDLVAAGVATASASCEQRLAGGVDPQRALALRRQVTVRRLEPTGAQP